MEIVKAGRPLLPLIDVCCEADLPVLLIAGHGVGKSQLLEQAARRRGLDYRCLDLSIMEPPDLVGLPMITAKHTIYAPPAFMPTGGKGILVFEELNRAERYMRAPCLQLLTARRLNDYTLPRGWLPVAAINPPDGDYEVSALDPALLSRFMKVQLVPDIQEWLFWAGSHGVHPAVIRYVRSDSTVFDAAESNPRSWAYVSNVVREFQKLRGVSRQCLRAAVCGLVGNERGAAFLATLKSIDSPLLAEDVLHDYPQHRDSVRGWIRDGHIDLVKASLLEVLKYLQPESDYAKARKSRKSWANLGRFLADLPGDLRAQAGKDFGRRGYDIPK